jgi:GDP-D-mannose dehydratase
MKMCNYKKDTVKINLGCGKDIREGWINMDKIDTPNVNIIHNLNEFPYPFGDNSIDYILMSHILEHLVDASEKFFRPAEVDILRGDSSKVRKVLGWKPEVSFEEMIKRMVRYDLRILLQVKEKEIRRKSLGVC